MALESSKRLGELQEVKINLGEDYLEIVKQRLGSLKSEVIIAIENHVVNGHHAVHEVEEAFSRLAGDSTIDAPPPDVKKKKKGK